MKRGAEIYSERYLLRARIKMKSIRERQRIHIEGEKQKINTNMRAHKLREKEIAEKFKKQIENNMANYSIEYLGGKHVGNKNKLVK